MSGVLVSDSGSRNFSLISSPAITSSMNRALAFAFKNAAAAAVLVWSPSQISAMSSSCTNPQGPVEQLFALAIANAPGSVLAPGRAAGRRHRTDLDRKSTRLNSSHANTSYAVFCLKKKAPADLERFADYQVTLARELNAYLVEYAQDRGLKPIAEPRVELVEDRGVRAGSVLAEARF